MPGRVIGDAGEHIGDVELWIETVELGAFDQRVHRRGAASAGVGAGKEIILATDGDTAQRSLGRVVVKCQATVVEAADEGGLERPHVAEGGG